MQLCCVVLFAPFSAIGQSTKNEVLTLGTFHFAFHNRDVIKTDKKDQIDVLEKKYQLEIEGIAKQISRFNPTIILIEKPPEFQTGIDRIYRNHIAGTYSSGREEYGQIWFRLVKNQD